MHELTGQQTRVLNFLRDQISTRGYAPTLREIGDHMSIRSTNGVNDHLRALERKGFIRREMMKSRAIVLTDRELGSEPRRILPAHDAATPGTWKTRKRCLRCSSITFSHHCPNCPDLTSLLEATP